MIRETDKEVFFNIDYLDLGNNFNLKHFANAIMENENIIDDINKLRWVDLDKKLIISANLNFGIKYEQIWDISEFLDHTEQVQN